MSGMRRAAAILSTVLFCACAVVPTIVGGGVDDPGLLEAGPSDAGALGDALVEASDVFVASDGDATVPVYLFFATSNPVTGAFAENVQKAGPEADRLCSLAAGDAGASLPGTWVAFFWSDQGVPPLNRTPFRNARADFAQVTPSGTAGDIVLSLDKSGVFTRMGAPIRNERGLTLATPDVWTGGETSLVSDCGGWKFTASMGTFGQATGPSWLQHDVAGNCAEKKSLYCMQTAR